MLDVGALKDRVQLGYYYEHKQSKCFTAKMIMEHDIHRSNLADISVLIKFLRLS